jgi:hypothetical protein
VKNLAYNQPLQLIRYESRNLISAPETFYSLDQLLFIHDYNIAISFAINKNLGNCSFSPILFDALDSDRNYTENLFNSTGSYVIRLKSAKSFLLLDSDYIYTGERKINNIPSDVFISKRNLTDQETILVEYAFSSVIN